MLVGRGTSETALLRRKGQEYGCQVCKSEASVGGDARDSSWTLAPSFYGERRCEILHRVVEFAPSRELVSEESERRQ